MLVAVGCLVPVLAVVVGVVSLVVHYAVRTPTSPYQVVFSTSGTECGAGDSEDEELVIDEETGEVLYCGVLPPIGVEGRARASGAFSAEEVARVTGLSTTLAADGGLGDGERADVDRLVAEIGRENGFDRTEQTLLERVTWQVGLYGVIGGLAVLACLGLWAHLMEGTAGPPAR